MYDEEIKQVRGAPTKHRILGFWCFNAGFQFSMLKELGPRTLILTSGTLSPLDSFESDLQTKFAYKLENPHVIDSSQV